MTTILMSILSGTLGFIVGFTLGIVACAFCARRFGKWSIYRELDTRNGKLNILGINEDDSTLLVSFDADGGAKVSYDEK